MSTAVLHVNSCGFCEKEIQDLVRLHRPLALVISEHKRDQKEDLDVIRGYKLASWSPAYTGIRGVAIYVRNQVQYNECLELNKLSKDGHFEIANIELVTYNVLLTGIYRSPNTTITNFCLALKNLLKNVNQDHAIVGDFNIDSRNNSETKELLRELGYQFNLRSATHVDGGCLDNFVTNFQPRKCRVMKANRDQVTSDHFTIEMIL